MQSKYISLDELREKQNAMSAPGQKKVKEVGFCNLCCSYCCVLTGFFGFVLLGIFSIALYKQWYFEAEMALLPKEERDTEYNTKGQTFLIGCLAELAIGIGSIFWVKCVNRRLKLAKAAKLK